MIAKVMTERLKERGMRSSCWWYQGDRCWRLTLLLFVSIMFVQITLYYIWASFYDFRRLSIPSTSTSILQFKLSNNDTKEKKQSPTISAVSGGTSDGGKGREGTLYKASLPETTTLDRTDPNKDNTSCSSFTPTLAGRVTIKMDPPSLEAQNLSHPNLSLGGHYRPHNCTSQSKVAILIPYRNRASHLSILVHHLHPILQRQQLDYKIYVIEQAGNDSFNRGMLMNVGVIEALKEYDFNCVILHDVDLVPEDDRNLYNCLDAPRHMSSNISTLHYRMPYGNYFGGVTALTAKQYLSINGFSNKFWGWGGEDDDFNRRVINKTLPVSRDYSKIGYYTMLTHSKATGTPKRFKILSDGPKRYATDGLNSIKYNILKIEKRRVFTLLSVSLIKS